MRSGSITSFLLGLALILGLTQGCGGSSSSGDDSTSAATSTDDSSSSGSSDDSTTISLTGSLSLTSSSSSNLALADSSSLDSYWLKCVTLDLTNANACIDQLDSNGAFELTCDGFKGKAFGCFILTGTDASSLTIAGVLNSSDLAMNGSTSTASMGLTFDPSTGSVGISAFEQKDSAATVVTQEAIVPEQVAGLDITDGTYGFCFSDLGSDGIDSIGKGKVDIDFTFNDCSGFTKEQYLYFRTATETGALPQLEVWESEDDREACINDAGALEYQISDGTRSYSFTEDNVSFTTLFDKIYNNASSPWIPSASVEAYQISLNDGAQKEDEVKESLESMYGTSPCTGLVEDLVDAYSKATLVVDKGFETCENYSFVSGSASSANNNAELDQEFNSGDGPPLEWCRDYKKADTDDARAAVKKRFVAECKAHVEGSAGEDLWQKQNLVWGFLETLAEGRHEGGGDGRFKGLREAFDLATEEGLDLSETGIGDLSTTCDSGDGDAALAALALAWMEVDWNWERARWVENAITSTGDLNCSAISFDHFGETRSFDNGRALLKSVLSSKFHQGEQETGIAQLNRQVCESSWDFDFSDVDTTASYFTDFWDNVNTSDFEPQFKSTVAESDKKDILINFIQAITAKSGETGFVTGGPFVYGCTAVNLKSQLTQLNDTSLGGGGPRPDDILRQSAWQLTEQIVQKAINDINTSYNSGTSPLTALAPDNSNAESEAATQLPALAAKMANLAINHPMRYGWMIFDMCHFVDLGTLTLDTSLSCGSALPDSLSSICGGPGGGGGSCTLPQYDTNRANTPKKQILAELARRITEIKGHDAFRTDETFKATKRKIVAQSACLPDAALSHQPVLDDNDNLTFEVQIRGPVKRRMAGEVTLDVDLEADSADSSSSDTEFIVEDSRIVENEGGLGSAGCYWGEVQRLKNLSYDSSTGVIKGAYTQAFIDTCRNANSDDSGSSGGSGEEEQHAWHQSFHATHDPSSQL